MYRIRLEGLCNAFITDVSDEEYIEYSSIDGGGLRYAEGAQADELVSAHEPERAAFLLGLLELVEPDEFAVTYTANYIQKATSVSWIAEDIQVSQG